VAKCGHRGGGCPVAGCVLRAARRDNLSDRRRWLLGSWCSATELRPRRSGV